MKKIQISKELLEYLTDNNFKEIDPNMFLKLVIFIDEKLTEQLTMHDVGSMFYCNKEVIALDKQCNKQCKDCRKWVKDTF